MFKTSKQNKTGTHMPKRPIVSKRTLDTTELDHVRGGVDGDGGGPIAQVLMRVTGQQGVVGPGPAPGPGPVG